MQLLSLKEMSKEKQLFLQLDFLSQCRPRMVELLNAGAQGISLVLEIDKLKNNLLQAL